MELREKTEVQQERNAGLFADVTIQSVSTGLISATLLIAGTALIILEAAAYGGFTSEQTISWMFAVYFFGGLFGVVMPLWLRIPITGGHSLTGVAFLATVTAQFTYPELIGGYVMSGLFIFFVGISGLFTKMVEWVPKEVISAMLAGLVASYVVRLVPSVKELPLVGGIALLSYFIFTRYRKRFPPALGAIVIAIITWLLTQGTFATETSQVSFMPSVQIPEFSWLSFVTLALPLAMLILSNDAAVGIGALESTGYKPPIRKIVTMSGVFSTITSLFGGQCANIAGMMTAICSSRDSGERARRYTAPVVCGVVTMIFGIFAWKIVPFIQSLPQAMISMLAGFSLIGVLLANLQFSFSAKNYSMASLTAFIVALSNVSFLHISAPVWALLLGALLSRAMPK
ncbi:benzoate/H(+) symporter BenE family transporter [Ammoniphilus sp. YIM 78166]|uniref:benzoate/H(+) symporter BenE family transporter n=1 Tax=Ammoniphilus sp. YIM 78166 TaxID=1644106 RepID=UPI00106F215B|nr:benzoate/H(+) symporter BenE family transporter [Ammoniphilus sp. YIM 78166]